MVKLKKKSLSRGSFRTHGRVIGNKNFFIFGLILIANFVTAYLRGAIQNYVDFCCRIFILQPIASFFSQNKVLS